MASEDERTWKPDVVVVDNPDSKVTANAAGALVAEALHEAFTQAADPKAFPEQIDKLHRIDPAVVKAEVLAAGFTLEAESDLLRNPADPKTALVFDPAIRGHTDQFIFKFRKPK